MDYNDELDCMREWNGMAVEEAPARYGPIRSFRDLIVWQKSMSLVSQVYDFTRGFPDYERFNLTSQIRRSSVSIPSNIAEGYGRRRSGDYVRFLHVALGSTYELTTQVEIAHNLRLLDTTSYDVLQSSAGEIERILVSLSMKLQPTPTSA